MSPNQENSPGSTRVFHGKTLDEQIEHFDAFPEEVTDHEDDLNNFYLKLPRKAARGMYEDMLESKHPKHVHGSDLRASQTLGEFFAVIDEEITRVGMDDLAKLYRALRARGYTHYDLVG